MLFWLKLAVAAAFAVLGHAHAAEQTLRVTAHADLEVLDTTANTTYVANRYGYLVYDTLFGLDS